MGSERRRGREGGGEVRSWRRDVEGRAVLVGWDTGRVDGRDVPAVTQRWDGRTVGQLEVASLQGSL